MESINGIFVSTSFMPPFSVCPVICGLNFNEVLLLSWARKSTILSLASRASSSL